MGIEGSVPFSVGLAFTEMIPTLVIALRCSFAVGYAI
jgi:hypothetical protein